MVNQEFRRNDRAADAVRKTTRRVENPEFRRSERAADAIRKTICRVENSEFRRNERAATAVREKSIVRKTQNSDAMNEQLQLRERELTRRAANSCKAVEQLIKQFHDIVATGSFYVCSSCYQLFYKQAVQSANSLCKLNGEKVRSILLGKTSVDGIE